MKILIALLKLFLPKTWWDWFNGYKSIIGMAGILISGVYYVLASMGIINFSIDPETLEKVVTAFGILFGVGMVHKGQKIQADLKKLIEDINSEDL